MNAYEALSIVASFAILIAVFWYLLSRGEAN